MAMALCGCGPPMIADFDTALRVAAQQDKELFIYYQSWLSPDCGQMQDCVRSPSVQQALSNKIACILDESYEPYQRVVAQYDVDRYPAVILIHRDGTYHRRIGLLNEQQILNFLEISQPPGRPPLINPQIPRQVDLQWQADYEAAFELAREQGRRVFIFYKSVISVESTDMLFNVFQTPAVAAHFDGTVNCLLDWGYPPNRDLMARYGINDVPAVVMVNPNGTYHAYKGRMTAAQLISFVRRSRTTPGNLPAGP